MAIGPSIETSRSNGGLAIIRMIKYILFLVFYCSLSILQLSAQTTAVLRFLGPTNPIVQKSIRIVQSTNIIIAISNNTISISGTTNDLKFQDGISGVVTLNSLVTTGSDKVNTTNSLTINLTAQGNTTISNLLGSNIFSTTLYASNSIFTPTIYITNNIFLSTNNAPSSITLTNGGYFWNSNNVLFWITAAKTNLVSDGR